MIRLWNKLKQAYHDFRDDKPGERFVNAHERWKGGHLLTRIGLVLAGVLLIVLGLFLALIPGVPGIVLGVPGIALIASRFRRVAVWMDWLEVKLRNVWHRWRQRFAPP